MSRSLVERRNSVKLFPMDMQQSPFEQQHQMHSGGMMNPNGQKGKTDFGYQMATYGDSRKFIPDNDDIIGPVFQ